MRFKSSLLQLGLVAASCGMGHAAPTRQIVPQGPVSYSSPVTGFAVWLPGKIRYPGHNDIISVFSPDASKAKTDSLTFLVTFGINLGQNPPSGPKVSNQEFLANLAKGYRYRSEPTSFQSHSIEQNGVPGHELSFVATQGIKGNRLRLYATPQRLYHIHAVGSEAALARNRALVDKVFDSFRILPQKQASIWVKLHPCVF